MKIQRKASVVWAGGIKDGKGAITVESGALQSYPYGFASRFEGQKGTNPEELLGAAHAGCFTMALSLMLTNAGFTVGELQTTADVTLEQVPDGFAITAIKLTLVGKNLSGSAEQFKELAAQAKAGCPVSKALSVPITLDVSIA